MASVQRAVSMGRSLRSQYSIKNRQPLSEAELVTRNPDEKNALLEMVEIIREELNVKEVIFEDNEEDMVEYEAKANFRILGKELGKDMKAAAARIEALSQTEIQGLLEGASLSMDIDGADGVRNFVLTADKLDIRRNEKANLRVLSEGTLTVGLNTEITRELSMEGDIRDLIRGVQNCRKESGFSVTDRISLTVFGSDKLKEAWDNFGSEVASETLAVKTAWAQTPGQVSMEAGDDVWLVKIQKSNEQ
jgi:isoleucyl-tRNA synthetase